MTDQTKPMDAERIAEIRARVEAATPGPWTTKTLHTTLADAAFVAASRQDLPYLLDLVDSLTAEREAALLDVAQMRDTQKDMGSLDDAVAAIHRRYPDDPYAEYLTSRLEDAVQPRKAELMALRAIVEEARALHKPTKITVLAVACYREECDHNDGDECLAHSPLVEVCSECIDVWDNDMDRDEPLPEAVRWPCATVKVLGRGLKGSGE